MQEESITLTEKDYLRLRTLLDSQENEDLEIEVERAKLVTDKNVPSDLVTMNSRFIYENVTEEKENELTIVYPNDADSASHKISVLAPLGAALIGLRVGQEINWMFPDGKTRTLKIKKILYQPEASGHWHL